MMERVNSVIAWGDRHSGGAEAQSKPQSSVIRCLGDNVQRMLRKNQGQNNTLPFFFPVFSVAVYGTEQGGF
jgi:hypothetical protein